MEKQNLNLLVLNTPITIYEQLKIEEALLRASSENWAVLNSGSLIPSIVMGISSHPEDVINLVTLKERAREGIEVIRRFSGGGTVVVDEKTVFFSLIISKSIMKDVFHGPKEYLEFVYHLIKPAFLPHMLELSENDFTLYDKKIGGNAQCFTQTRFLHHTSFLWSWERDKMDLLLHPKKIPSYRRDRPHTDFCGMLADHFQDPHNLLKNLSSALSEYFHITFCSEDHPSVVEAITSPHRKALEKINIY